MNSPEIAVEPTATSTMGHRNGITFTEQLIQTLFSNEQNRSIDSHDTFYTKKKRFIEYFHEKNVFRLQLIYFKKLLAVTFAL